MAVPLGIQLEDREPMLFTCLSVHFIFLLSLAPNIPSPVKLRAPALKMDIDSKLDNADVKSGDEGSSSMQVDSKGTVEEKDELTDSMNKLNVEASSSGQMGHSFRRKPGVEKQLFFTGWFATHKLQGFVVM
uniref:Uncharacterized protein n=1 Tax=Salix viminalis TaxID=40686 RepID=A0A6N2MWL0_SALVM